MFHFTVIYMRITNFNIFKNVFIRWTKKHKFKPQHRCGDADELTLFQVLVFVVICVTGCFIEKQHHVGKESTRRHTEYAKHERVNVCNVHVSKYCISPVPIV